MWRAENISYGVVALIFIVVAWLGLATPLVTILFTFFALPYFLNGPLR